MVCGDPATGRRSGPEPLLTLASFRRRRASINFGVLFGSGPSSGGGGCGSGHDDDSAAVAGVVDSPAGKGCDRTADALVLRVGMEVRPEESA